MNRSSDPKVLFPRPKSSDVSNVPKHPKPPTTLNSLAEKVGQQERINSYIMDQLSNLDSTLARLQGRALSSFDEKRLDLLEQNLKRQETEFRSLEGKISVSYGEFRGMDSKIRGIQRQEDDELNQLRSLIHEKMQEDHKIHLKNKEKFKVLFTELVRLGEKTEKNADQLQNLSVSLESRINKVESSPIPTVNYINDSEFNTLIGLAEKVDERVHHIEKALYSLNDDQKNDHKAIGKVETNTIRLQDEVSSFLKRFQGDIQHRLELRTSELLNKLLQEQEERLRNSEDLKYTFEVKDKIINDKLQFNRDEFKDRLSSVETNLKNQLSLLEESLSRLQASQDLHVKSCQTSISEESQNRNISLTSIREELENLTEETRGALENMQRHSAGTFSKITEMVKTEIERRGKGEKDLKSLVQSTIQGLMQEISLLKDSSEHVSRRLDKEVNECQQSISTKADLLSRFTEDEIKKMRQSANKFQEQTKAMVSTLTESLKHTILTNEGYKNEMNEKMDKLDRSLTHLKTEMARSDNVSQSNVVYKLKELQYTFEHHLAQNSTELEARIDTLARMVDSSFENIDKDINSQKETVGKLLNNLNKDIMEQHKLVCEDLAKLLQGLEALQSETDSISEDFEVRFASVQDRMLLVESNAITQLSAEKMIREHMIYRIMQDFDEFAREMEAKTDKDTNV